MDPIPNHSQRSENLSATANQTQEIVLDLSISQLEINDDSQPPETPNNIDISNRSHQTETAPRYTESSLSTHFSPTLALLDHLPKSLRACTIHFDNELVSLANNLTTVTKALEGIEAEDWKEIRRTETGRKLVAGMEKVEKEILNSDAFSDHGMQGVCNAAWALMGVIDGFLGEGVIT